ncbi:sodium:proton antiporter NhaD [Methylomicrobium album]|uniref:Na+/H+ antiporter NhaD-like permease n=1 Tax=Methylomicrobium album BG8 TaxID=686340 RepID=H8GH05_METAL|nr:sodium:proton antiporter NhaD [Methylomicrobium album]EIC31280.1 Na+/H+ antiporter NhaD-like permease [Methylomicrobium album BG8]
MDMTYHTLSLPFPGLGPVKKPQDHGESGIPSGFPIKKSRYCINSLPFFVSILAFLLPSPGFAQEAAAATQVDLQHHFIGYLTIAITVIAYIIAMTEDLHQLSKAKPMVLGSVLIWFAIFIYYSTSYGTAKEIVPIFQSNLMAYAELFLFITVSMTFLNAMTERGIFDSLRIVLANKQYTYRQLFWITGALAFLLSTVISSLAVGLLMGYIILEIGKGQSKFVGLAGLNAVVGANAGGTMSPLGGISTFFVWQQNALQFTEFFTLTIPCIVNFLVPAFIMQFSVTKETPNFSKEKPVLKRGSKRIIFIFILTFSTAILSNVFLDMPAIIGMMFGLAMLQFFAYYLTKSEKIHHFLTEYEEHEKQSYIESQKGFDVFKCIAGVDWDTLLFFYGAMMIVGALSFLGYLDAMAHYLFTVIGATVANILIGLSSSAIDNGTLMFAVLNMHPSFEFGQWLLLTFTLGVGGSLLAIGSAPGLHVLGLMKGRMKEGEGYTFTLHLRWMPVILLGFFAGIFTLWLINGGKF